MAETLTQKHARYEREMEESNQRIKDFLVGAAKAVTTDIPGFFADVVDKLSGDTKTLGEKNRSAQMFEAVTGVKSSNSPQETLGSLINPESALKAIAIPLFIKLGGAGAAKAGVMLDELKAQGKTDRELWSEFGVYQTPDDPQTWKTIIPDNNAELVRDKLDVRLGYQSSTADGPMNIRVEPTGGVFSPGIPLPEFLSHPELYATKVDIGLQDTKVKPIFLGGYAGSYNSSNDTLRVGNLYPQEAILTTLHETQHAVQAKTGLTAGGNPTMFFQQPEKFAKAKGDAYKIYKGMAEEFDKKYTGQKIHLDGKTEEDNLKQGYAADFRMRKLTAANLRMYPDVLESLPAKARADYYKVQQAERTSNTFSSLSDTSNKLYNRIAGEAEARLAEKQYMLGDYTTYPLDLYDQTELRKLIKDPATYPKLDRSPAIQKLMDDVLATAAELESKKAVASAPPATKP